MAKGAGTTAAQGGSIAMAEKLSAEEFAARLEEWHPGRFELLTPFLGMHQPITVKCRICGLATPYKRAQSLRKSRGKVGCEGCKPGYLSQVKSFTHEQFAAALRARHPRIELTSSYAGMSEPVAYSCACGYSRQVTQAAFLLKQGCGACEKRRNKDRKRNVRLAEHEAILAARFADSIRLVGPFITSDDETSYECIEHGPFPAVPYKIEKAAYGCPACVRVKRAAAISAMAVQRGLDNILRVHGDSIMVLSHNGMKDRALFRCDAGHEWGTTLASVARGSGCWECNHHRPYSQQAIEWMEGLARHLSIQIGHEGNGGEYQARGESGRPYYLDGYTEGAALVVEGHRIDGPIAFEFYGDAFHGNPAVFAPDEECCGWRQPGKTAAELHQATVERERDLVAAGISVVVVWETDFEAGKLASYVRVANEPAGLSRPLANVLLVSARNGWRPTETKAA